MIAVCVPGTLFIVSFVTLMVITQTVRVGDDARMRCKWCNDAHTSDTDLRYEAIERTDEDREARANKNTEKDELAMQHLSTHSKKEESKVNLLEIENTNYSNA